MSKTMRLCVLAVSLFSLLGALTSSAGAITWHNSGSTSFTGSGAAGSISVTGVTLTCASAVTNGSVPALTTGNVYRASGTADVTGCTLAGVPWTVHCSWTLTGTSQDGTGMGSAITGTSDVYCTSYQFGVNICQSHGVVSGAYFNTLPAAATLNAGTSIRFTHGTGGSCPMGVNEPSSFSGRTATSTSLNPPTITRTP